MSNKCYHRHSKQYEIASTLLQLLRFMHCVHPVFHRNDCQLVHLHHCSSRRQCWHGEGCHRHREMLLEFYALKVYLQDDVQTDYVSY